MPAAPTDADYAVKRSLARMSPPILAGAAALWDSLRDDRMSWAELVDQRPDSALTLCETARVVLSAVKLA